MIIDMTALRDSAPRLYRTIVSDLGLPESGKHEITLPDKRLSLFTYGELTGWLTAQQSKTPDIAKPPAQEPAAPPEPQIDYDEILRQEAADLKARSDEAAARNRLNEYSNLGLENSQANFDAIKNFVNSSPAKGYWSWQIVDVAIQTLGDKLTWKTVVEPSAPPPTPVQQAEVLTVLKDGSKQLRLDVVPNKHHTVEQLKDWHRRTTGGKLWQPRSYGSFGSRL